MRRRLLPRCSGGRGRLGVALPASEGDITRPRRYAVLTLSVRGAAPLGRCQLPRPFRRRTEMSIAEQFEIAAKVAKVAAKRPAKKVVPKKKPVAIVPGEAEAIVAAIEPGLKEAAKKAWDQHPNNVSKNKPVAVAAYSARRG